MAAKSPFDFTAPIRKRGLVPAKVVGDACRLLVDETALWLACMTDGERWRWLLCPDKRVRGGR